MSFSFDGLFATAGAEALGELLRDFPAAQGRRVTAPFEGLAVRWPAGSGPAELETALLPALARRYPSAVFVWLQARPVDGQTQYRGLALQADQVLCRREFGDPPEAPPAPAATRSLTGRPLPPAGLPVDFPHSLAALVAPLGVRLRTGYFAPFSLRFWETGG